MNGFSNGINKKIMNQINMGINEELIDYCQNNQNNFYNLSPYLFDS